MNLFSCNCKSCPKTCNHNKTAAIEQLKIALVGNPNVGKSVIFNALSGFYAEVSNYPGTTVDISIAYIEEGQLIDTPGAYSVGNYTDDEIVTKNILQTADIVINVVSAISLERDLFLTQQLIDMDFPMVVVVNQIDETRARGIKIDTEMLETLLDLKIIPAVAIHNQGIADIKKSISAKEYKVSSKKTPYIKELFDNINISRCEKFVKLVEIESKESENELDSPCFASENELSSSCFASENHQEKELIYSQRREIINCIRSKVIFEGEKSFDLAGYIGNILLNPIVGIITAAIMLFIFYQIIATFVAGNVVDFLSLGIKTNYFPWISGLSHKYIPFGPVNEILVGEFGILTMTVELIFGVLLPLIISFYLFMAILEDTGYLPRLAVLTDRLLSKIGLNGRAVIPLLLGFGCSTMAIITTRILGSKKERIIATVLLGLAIPCSAQIGVIITLIAAIGGFKIWILYILTIFTIMALTGTFLSKFLKGQTTDLLIDIPPMRLPIIRNTINKMIFRVINFLKEASPMFIIGSLIISVFKITGILNLINKMFAPISVYLLKMPESFSNVFIMGMIRRDFGSVEILKMAGLNGNAGVLDHAQIFTAAVMITLFVPCIAAVVVIFKERGFKEASLIWVGSFIVSILTGAVLIRISSIFF